MKYGEADMKKIVAAIVTALACMLMACLSYIYINRIKVITHENFIGIYDIVTGEIKSRNDINNMNIKKSAETQQRERDIENIEISLKIDRDKCSDDYPLLLTVSNKSMDTLLELNFNVDARRNSWTSDSIADRDKDYLMRGYPFNVILDPEKNGTTCYRAPKLKPMKELPDIDNIVFVPFDIEYTFLNHPGGNEALRKRFNK